jgi:signal-transduction protein with cAMP-binding, CBS, and nucleotidyltransferase domain
MTERKVRHLPVMDHGKVIGMVSIRDLLVGHSAMNAFIAQQLKAQ